MKINRYEFMDKRIEFYIGRSGHGEDCYWNGVRWADQSPQWYKTWEEAEAAFREIPGSPQTIKDLQAKNEALEKRVAALEARLAVNDRTVQKIIETLFKHMFGL